MEAKTVQNVINELRTGHQIVISIPLACQLINNAVTELVSLYATAAIPTPIDIEGAKANEPQALPNLGITKVMLDNKPYRAYTADSDSITFKSDGTFNVTAILAPDDVLSAADDIPVNVAYHSCVVTYAAYHSNTEPDKPKNNDQFYALSQEIHNRLSKVKHYGRFIPARVWR